MLRSIMSRVLSGGRRTGTPTSTPGSTATPGSATGGGSANKDIERGAKSLLRGLGRKRGGL